MRSWSWSSFEEDGFMEHWASSKLKTSLIQSTSRIKGGRFCDHSGVPENELGFSDEVSKGENLMLGWEQLSWVARTMPTVPH